MRPRCCPCSAVVLALAAFLISATGNLTTAEAAPRSRGGQLKISYDNPGRDPMLREIATILRDEKVFEGIAGVVHERLSLPHDLDVVFGLCDEPNAFYDPEERQIVMCYELFALFADVFADPEASEEEVGSNILGAAAFVFLHEVGHALSDILDLPITGKEEDAVDDLATLLLLSEGETGVDAAFSALLHFAAMADQVEEVEELAFWDEHSLDAQRVYGVACLIYGSDPEGYDDMVGEDGLPEERAVRCPAEFEQKARSWDKLLGPYFKE